MVNDITKDRLHDRVDELLKNGTLLNKPNRDKDSLRINRENINDPSINISSVSRHSPPEASPTTDTNSRKSFVASKTTIQPKFTIT